MPLTQRACEGILMDVIFVNIHLGFTYSRHHLARLWGCASFHALARGVVTPRGDNKIILFVTEEKQRGAEPYHDELSNNILIWEGPNDHFGEDRLLDAATSGDEIHLFHRDRHHRDFVYRGQLAVVSCERMTDRPSRFTFHVVGLSNGC